MAAEGDRVAVENYARTASGKIYNNRFQLLFEIRDGRIHAATGIRVANIRPHAIPGSPTVRRSTSFARSTAGCRGTRTCRLIRASFAACAAP